MTPIHHEGTPGARVRVKSSIRVRSVLIKQPSLRVDGGGSWQAAANEAIMGRDVEHLEREKGR